MSERFLGKVALVAGGTGGLGRAVSQLVEKILAEHGRLDALVNTVGGYAGGV